MDFGQLNAEIGWQNVEISQKMGTGRLLFLALHMYTSVANGHLFT